MFLKVFVSITKGLKRGGVGLKSIELPERIIIGRNVIGEVRRLLPENKRVVVVSSPTPWKIAGRKIPLKLRP